jgi:dihydrofolate reductase
MAMLTVFNFISLNACYKGPDNDVSWHRHDPEENGFAVEMLKKDHILLFGRRTYQMMAGYWPTDAAKKTDPLVARGMNEAEKIVFSRTLKKSDPLVIGWQNTTIVHDQIVAEMKKMKQQSGKNMTLLGSGSILTQFAEAGLIDEYQFMVDPVVIAGGTPVFNGVQHQLDLQCTLVKQFKTGVVLLCYRPAIKKNKTN